MASHGIKMDFSISPSSSCPWSLLVLDAWLDMLLCMNSKSFLHSSSFASQLNSRLIFHQCQKILIIASHLNCCMSSPTLICVSDPPRRSLNSQFEKSTSLAQHIGEHTSCDIARVVPERKEALFWVFSYFLTWNFQEKAFLLSPFLSILCVKI